MRVRHPVAKLAPALLSGFPRPTPAPQRREQYENFPLGLQRLNAPHEESLSIQFFMREQGASGLAGLGFMPCGTEPPRGGVSAIR